MNHTRSHDNEFWVYCPICEKARNSYNTYIEAGYRHRFGSMRTLAVHLAKPHPIPIGGGGGQGTNDRDDGAVEE